MSGHSSSFARFQATQGAERHVSNAQGGSSVSWQWDISAAMSLHPVVAAVPPWHRAPD